MKISKKIFLLIGLVFLASVSGMVVVNAQREVELPSVRIIPDSPFYFLKSASESVGNIFRFGNTSKAQRHSRLALKRTAEIQKLVEKDSDLDLIEKTINRQEEQLEKALSRVNSAFNKGTDISEISEAAEKAAYNHMATMEENFNVSREENRNILLRSRDSARNKQIEALKILSQNNPERATEISAEMAQDRLQRMERYAEEDKEGGEERRVQRMMNDYGSFLESFDGIVQGDEALVDYLIDVMGEQSQALQEAEIFMDHFSPQMGEEIRRVRRGLSESALNLQAVKDITDIPGFEDFDDLSFDDLDLEEAGIPSEIVDLIPEELIDGEIGIPSMPSVWDDEKDIEEFVNGIMEIFRQFDETDQLITNEEEVKENLRDLAQTQKRQGEDLRENLRITEQRIQELPREKVLEVVKLFIEEGEIHPLVGGREPVTDDEEEQQEEPEPEPLTGPAAEKVENYAMGVLELFRDLEGYEDMIFDEDKLKEDLRKEARELYRPSGGFTLDQHLQVKEEDFYLRIYETNRRQALQEYLDRQGLNVDDYLNMDYVVMEGTEEEKIEIFVTEMIETLKGADQFNQIISSEEGLKDLLREMAVNDLQEGLSLKEQLLDMKGEFEERDEEEKLEFLRLLSQLMGMEEKPWDME